MAIEVERFGIYVKGRVNRIWSLIGLSPERGFKNDFFLQLIYLYRKPIVEYWKTSIEL